MSNAGISSSDRANQYAIQQTYSRLLRLTSELLNVAAAIVTTVDGGPLRRPPWPILRAQPAYAAAEQVIATLLPYPSPGSSPASQLPAQSLPPPKRRRSPAASRKARHGGASRS